MVIQDHSEKIARITSDAKWLVFDNDGVTYKITPAFNAHCDAAAARAVVAMGVPISFEQALLLVKESYEQYSSLPPLFVERYGVDGPALHDAYHALVGVDVVTKCPDSPALFAFLRRSCAMLTHGNRDWAIRSLTHTGLKPYFDGEFIFTSRDVGFQLKSVSDAPFRHVLDACGAEAARTPMIEDTPRNLIYPKKLGMPTILFTQGKIYDPADYPFIDAFVYDMREFLIAATGDYAAKALPHLIRPANALRC